MLNKVKKFHLYEEIRPFPDEKLCYDDCGLERYGLKQLSDEFSKKKVKLMDGMTVTFKNPDEILDFVNTVSKYEFDMDMRKGRVVVDAKSLLGIMHLGLNNEIELQVYSDNCEELRKEIQKYAA